MLTESTGIDSILTSCYNDNVERWNKPLKVERIKQEVKRMARIGNETKLVLKLAKEIMSRREGAYRRRMNGNPDKVAGFIDCLQEYQAVFDLLIIDLEGKV